MGRGDEKCIEWADPNMGVFSVCIQVSLRGVVENACKQYIRSRPPPSSESVKRSKELSHADIYGHPLLGILR